LHRAAVTRIEYLMENFPKYPEMDSALCILGQAQRRLDETEEAEKTFARLRAEYPESQKCKKAKGSAS
jgi:TolA-binding protein